MTQRNPESGTRTIVVTGAAGFIGFHLAHELLKDGHRVVGIDSLSDYYDPRIKEKRLEILGAFPEFRFHKADITAYESLKEILEKEAPHEIVHLAAQAGVRYSLSNPWTYIETNERGTLNIFESARALGIPRVLYASSSSVYGSNAKTPMSEHDPVESQISVYGATKKANESLAHVYNHLYGIELTGLRFFTVYGIWGRPDLALFKFTKHILAGEPIDVYNEGKMRRSFTHIRDIVGGIRAILAQAPDGKNDIYNLGGAEAVPLLDFIALIERHTGRQASKRLMPLQAGDVPETVADCSKAHQDFGYVPAVSMEEGVAEFVTWFKEHEDFLTGLNAPKQ